MNKLVTDSIRVSNQWMVGTSSLISSIKYWSLGRIVLPQALLRCLPLYKTQAVALIKGTSIVGYVSVMDLTKAGDYIRGRTFDAFFPLLLVALIYLILSWLFGAGIDLIERRLTPKHRSL